MTAAPPLSRVTLLSLMVLSLMEVLQQPIQECDLTLR
jgi:hypothetical protein